MPMPAERNAEAGARPAALPAVTAFMVRMATRASRSRWFSFLRRVFQYQNASRSDVVSNPFNSRPWLALELAALLAQIAVVTVTMAVSQDEKPVWPLRVWMASYNMGNVLSLPLLYWRYLHSNGALGLASDVEQQRNSAAANEQYSGSYLMNKSRTFLELFYAIWFVMGNVWVFDSRLGSFGRAPRLHALCVALLAWNAVLYSFPFLLFLLLCCFVPFLSRALGYNMNLASTDRGASDEQISRLPHWQFKEAKPKDEHLVDGNQDCCICLARYREREEVRQLPCTHIFHLSCVDQWLRIMSSCPLCKQELEK